MHTSWTIGRKLTAAFSVMAFLLATASIAGLVDSNRSKQSLERTAAVGATVRAAAEIEAYIRSMDGNQKLILVAGLTGVVERSEAGHKGVQDAMREIPARLDLLKTGATTDQARQAADGIAAHVDAWKRHHEQILALVAKQEFDQALTIDLGDSYATQKKIVDQAESLKRMLTLEADANASEARAAFVVATTIAVVVVIAAFLVGGAATVVIRGITKALAAAASELRASAQQVASASGQVAASSQSLSQGATEQAASLEETSASMEEMASMTRQNAENSQSAATQVAETERLVTGANTALTDLVATMTTIRESSGQVTKIIKTIDEIAFQTNILALNAAVEAARAGDAGMGFAVVADEVRNLAQRSAQAAKDTAALIESSATNAASGGDKVDAVVTAMDAITASSGRVRGLVDEVSVASRQQAQGIDQVTLAIAQMEKVTQTTAATAEESAAASQELNSQAGTALDVVVRLEGMVHGGHGGPQAHVTAPARSPAAAGPADPKVLRLVRGSVPARRPSPQEHVPLEDTGTFGRF